MAFSVRGSLSLTLSKNLLAFTLEFMWAAELFRKNSNKFNPTVKTDFLNTILGYAKRKINAEETVSMAGNERD